MRVHNIGSGPATNGGDHIDKPSSKQSRSDFLTIFAAVPNTGNDDVSRAVHPITQDIRAMPERGE